jgi:DNA mismatch repair protein MutL
LQLSSINLSDTLYSDRVGKVLKAAETQSGYGLRESGIGSRESEDAETQKYGDAETSLVANNQQLTTDPTQNSKFKTQNSSSLTPHSSPLKAIAQVHNMYILAEHSSGVWLIEQHIAHERVLYEQLCDRWKIVCLQSPIVLNRLSIAQVEQLQRLELEVEPFGEQAWVVRTAPELLSQRDDCADALWELSLGGDLQTAQVATACRSAIRNGTALNLEEMQTLLNEWQQTRNLRTCPHGRPICLMLEESALSRFFRRHWVIGKSHGI